MKYIMLLIAALTLTACPHQASRQSLQTAYDLSRDSEYSGKEFYDRCSNTQTDTRENQRERDICTWYIANVTSNKDVKQITCHPQWPSARMRHDMVVDYMNKNPDIQHNTARQIIINAMNSRYPCS
ncbi:hypothetical protein WH96_04945 [Kiloniella spongiae]|uniref:Rap1a immunity protein domain-containing protein n=1 Tax=Kiloniella spongiae TaxID=1489064 RepID=A0A0H2MH14_9PROT|nr:hypothetical protein WH96_04945 [Kiloniella spongiae]